MWIKLSAAHLVLAALGLCAGAAVSAGTFAFLLVIGILPRMMCKTNVREQVLLLENLVIAGVLYGCIRSTVSWRLALCFGHVSAGLFGLSAGIFVGQIAAALAEILHTFPILFRRIRLKEGLSWVMTAMALGKLAGSLFYFLCGYATIGA